MNLYIFYTDRYLLWTDVIVVWRYNEGFFDFSYFTQNLLCAFTPLNISDLTLRTKFVILSYFNILCSLHPSALFGDIFFLDYIGFAKNKGMSYIGI